MITYFYRNHRVGFSIGKVSDLITTQIKEKKIVEVPSEYASVKGLLKNLWCVYRNRDRKGVNHIVGDINYCILALLGCKSVLTIHDICIYNNSKGLKRLIFKYLWYVLPIRYATKVVCISEETKRAIQQFTNRKDIEVIYNAVDPSYTYVEKPFDKDNVSVLLIGTAWNKNIERTLEAIKGLNVKVVIVGSLLPSQEQYLRDNNFMYTRKENLSNEEIRQSYAECDIVSFCSIYEGFGMPIIEANAIGRPIITSNIEPLKEVGGNAALFVNPYSVVEIRNGITTLLNDEKRRNALVFNGLQNVKRFNAQAIKDQYVKLYNEIK